MARKRKEKHKEGRRWELSNNVLSTLAAVLTIVSIVFGAFWAHSAGETKDVTSDLKQKTQEVQQLQQQNDQLRAPTTTTSTTAVTQASSGTLDFAANPYMDLDNRVASATGGRDYEVYFSGSVFTVGAGYNTSADTVIKVVPTANATASTCESSTVLKIGSLYLSDVKQDQSVCIKTNESRWVLLTSASDSNSSSHDVWKFDYKAF